MIAHRARFLTALVCVGLAVACGKKGDPLAPLRPVPLGIADISARRANDGRITLSMVVPDGNVDGSTPAAVSRIDLYSMTTAAGDAAPAAGTIVGNAANLRRQFPVQPAPAEETPGSNRPPAPGEPLVFAENADAVPGAAGAGAVHYVAVPVAGSGRGRAGQASDVVTVPLAAVASPAALAVSNDETSFVLMWQPGGESQTFRVLGVSRDGNAASVTTLTETPLAVTDFKVPVEFGRERCFAVQAIQANGRTTVESLPTAAQCLTPVDRYPPAAPTRLEAVQEGTAMTLIWAPVDAPDLAGYVVLRADAPSDRLQPLMREPLTQATYRDTTVTSGATYIYAVIALDKVGNPSEQSQRQTVTVR